MDGVDPQQQVVERIKQSADILVTVGTNPSVDSLSAALALTMALNKIGKHGTAVFSGTLPPAISFLEPAKTFENDVSSLRDFIIALDKNKADHLRYKVEDDVVRIFITPYRTTITPKDLQFSDGDFNVDLVAALGVEKRADLDKAITAHGRILHDATVITINNNDQKNSLGAIDWQNPTASSLSEMVVTLVEALQQGVLDQQISTALLTGIVAATGRFSNQQTTPQVMALAARLMAAGANQQLIATKLNAETSRVASSKPVAPAATEVDDDLAKAADGADKGALKINHQGPTLGEAEFGVDVANTAKQSKSDGKQKGGDKGNRTQPSDQSQPKDAVAAAEEELAAILPVVPPAAQQMNDLQAAIKEDTEKENKNTKDGKADKKQSQPQDKSVSVEPPKSQPVNAPKSPAKDVKEEVATSTAESPKLVEQPPVPVSPAPIVAPPAPTEPVQPAPEPPKVSTPIPEPTPSAPEPALAQKPTPKPEADEPGLFEALLAPKPKKHSDEQPQAEQSAMSEPLPEIKHTPLPPLPPQPTGDEGSSWKSQPIDRPVEPLAPPMFGSPLSATSEEGLQNNRKAILSHEQPFAGTPQPEPAPAPIDNTAVPIPQALPPIAAPAMPPVPAVEPQPANVMPEPPVSAGQGVAPANPTPPSNPYSVGTLDDIEKAIGSHQSAVPASAAPSDSPEVTPSEPGSPQSEAEARQAVNEALGLASDTQSQLAALPTNFEALPPPAPSTPEPGELDIAHPAYTEPALSPGQAQSAPSTVSQPASPDALTSMPQPPTESTQQLTPAPAPIAPGNAALGAMPPDLPMPDFNNLPAPADISSVPPPPPNLLPPDVAQAPAEVPQQAPVPDNPAQFRIPGQ